MTEEELQRENKLLHTIIDLRKQNDDLTVALHRQSSKVAAYRQLFDEMISWRYQYVAPHSDFPRGVLYFLGTWIDRAKFFLRVMPDEKEFQAHIQTIEKHEERIRSVVSQYEESMKNRKPKKAKATA